MRWECKVASERPQTGRVKLKISPVTGEVEFSFGEGKKSNGSGFTRSITEGYMNAVHIHILMEGVFQPPSNQIGLA